MNKISTGNLSEAQVTLLMPLWSRAMEAKQPAPMLVDKKAEEIVQLLDFDFSRFEGGRVPKADFCIRSSIFDLLVSQFIEKNPAGTVVELGVGLDSRFDRLDNGSINWVELDFPSVVDLRKKLFDIHPRRRLLAASLKDSAFIEQLVEIVEGSVMFVAEGVFYFFTRQQVMELLGLLVARFRSSSIVFDAQSSWYLWYSNLRQPVPNAKMLFAVDNAHELETLHKDAVIKRFIRFGDESYYGDKLQRLSSMKRWALRLMPCVRNSFKIVEIKWDADFPMPYAGSDQREVSSCP